MKTKMIIYTIQCVHNWLWGMENQLCRSLHWLYVI